MHHVVIAPKGKSGTEIEPFKWLNVILGNLKTSLTGTYHAFKFRKYAATRSGGCAILDSTERQRSRCDAA
jgi:hypothetical protein